jgi:hypothetical protein
LPVVSIDPPAAAQTVGFAEPDDAPVPIAAAIADPAAAPPAAPPPPTSAPPPGAGGDLALTAETAAPAPAASSPAPPAAPPPPTSPAPAGDGGDLAPTAETAAPAPAASSPAPPPAPPPTVTAAPASDGGDPASPVEGALAALPDGPGDVQPSALAPRAERPPGAPQASDAAAARAALPSGQPVEDLPAVVVEPQLVAADEVPPPAERSSMLNKRLFRRVVIDAGLEIDGSEAKLIDLSMGGFAAANANQLLSNTIVPVVVRLAVDGVDISARMRARIIYTNVMRSGGRFVGLTASQTAFLRFVVTWRGAPLGALGTTTLLGAIVRPADRERPAARPAFREPEPPPPRQTPWWSRWLGRLLGVRRGAT